METVLTQVLTDKSKRDKLSVKQASYDAPAGADW